jgi:hypothetical protein
MMPSVSLVYSFFLCALFSLSVVSLSLLCVSDYCVPAATCAMGVDLRVSRACLRACLCVAVCVCTGREQVVMAAERR